MTKWQILFAQNWRSLLNASLSQELAQTCKDLMATWNAKIVQSVSAVKKQEHLRVEEINQPV
jgi:hypothetical protein